MSANNLKWSSIGNVVTAVFGSVARLAALAEDDDGGLDTVKAAATLRTLKDRVFRNRIEASVKIDGTNVGKDAEGNMYGRNQMVHPGADTYQKTSLAAVKEVDVATVLEKILAAAEVERDDVAHFVLYGELVCNKTIYDYAYRGRASGWLVFGAMIRARNDEVKNTLLGKMTEAKFAVEDIDERLRVSVNERFRRLVPEMAFAPRVELEETCTLADLVLLGEVYNVVAEGHHEGLVLLEQDADRQTTVVMKWKNGYEPAGAMGDKLLKVKKLLDHPGVLEPIINEVFEGDELGKVESVIDRLLKVFDNTNKIDLNADGTVQDKTMMKTKAEKKDAGKKPAFVHPNKVYHEAIQSAKSKFDHCDTFFAGGEEGFEEYLGLIRGECHGDVVEALGEAAVGGVEGAEHGKKVREVMEREWKKFLKRSPN